MGKIFLFLSLLLALGCSSEQKELLDLAIDPPGRKTLPYDKVGVNNFFVEPGFGSIPSQYSEIKNTLGRPYVRVLMAWTDAVQPTPSATPNYGLFDEIVENVPAGVDILIVLAHTPRWIQDPSNWIDGNPRKTWVERWLKPTVRRYAGQRGIVGWEIWNEPDLTVVLSDIALELENSSNYLELLRLGAAAVRALDPTRLVVIAATSAINQNYPQALNYNKRLFEGGAANLIDVWNIHYYGELYENVVRNNGVGDFLNSVGKPIWVTESGNEGVNNQLAYAEKVWPFLDEEVRGIERFYWYEFASQQSTGFGLRTNDPSFPVSDLYVNLRDR